MNHAVVLSYLQGNSTDGVITVSHRELSQRTGLSIDQVRRVLKLLVDEGYVSEVEQGNGRSVSTWKVSRVAIEGGDPIFETRSKNPSAPKRLSPFNQLPLRGSSWLGFYPALFTKIARRQPPAECDLCGDIGYVVVRAPGQYTRRWVEACAACAKGATIPEPPDPDGYVEPKIIGFCHECGNTGWKEEPDLVLPNGLIEKNRVSRCSCGKLPN
jgi:hypothetical protein